MDNWITCSICGFRYDPAENPSCGQCPLHQGCRMACCPNCGASNINPAGSKLATFLNRLLEGKKHVSSTTSLENHEI